SWLAPATQAVHGRNPHSQSARDSGRRWRGIPIQGNCAHPGVRRRRREPQRINRRPHAMHKLLVIDDEEAMRRLLRLNLSDTYEIIDTGDPEAGLALAMQHKPSAILLDLRM